MKRFQPWLLLILVFLAGLALGVVGTRATVRHFVYQAARDPEVMREMIEKRVSRRLRLDPQQQAKVREILVRKQAELKDLRSEFQPRFLSIMDAGKAEIESALTPEQRQRFEQLQQENRQWWQPR